LDQVTRKKKKLDQEPFNASAAPPVHFKSHDPAYSTASKFQIAAVVATGGGGAACATLQDTAVFVP